MEKNNPWISIWTKPRQTISEIISTNPNRSLWVLSAIYGFSALLNLFQSGSIGYNPLAVFIFAAILAPFWGYFVFAVWSWVVMFIGKLFKGQGNYQTIRAAYAWSNVPLILNIPIWILMGLMYGRQLFLNFPDGYLLTNGAVTVLFFLLMGKVVLSIWSLVIYVNTLAVVQQYSILRSIGNIVVAMIALSLIAMLIWVIMANLFGVSVERSPTAFMLLNDGATLRNMYE